MKKRILALLCAVSCLFAMAFLFSACGHKTAAQPDEPISGSDEPFSQPADNQDQEDEEIVKDVDLPNEYRLPGTDLYVNTPDYMNVENSLTRVFIKGDDLAIAITGSDIGTETEPEKIQLELMPLVFDNLDNYIPAQTLDITDSDYVEVGDHDVYRYEGTVNCGDFSLPMFGYTTYVDGIQVSIFGYAGSASNLEPTQEQIDQMHSDVSAIMQTLRVED